MAHPEQQQFCNKVRARYPSFFQNVVVLDVGSLDINGSNRNLFTDGVTYTGIDIAEGRNVDAVSKAHEWNTPDGSYDTIISTECFEHDMFYAQTLGNIYRMLRRGGLFVFTCATNGRPEHGTSRCLGGDSPFTSKIAEWCDYYKNLDERDIRQVLNVEELFSEHLFETNPTSHDLYFYGIKR